MTSTDAAYAVTWRFKSTVPVTITPTPPVPLTRWQQALAYLRALYIGLLVALTLTGCASVGAAPAPRVDEVRFDRAAFAFTYADWFARLKADCAKVPSDVFCQRLDLLDAQIRQTVIDAPKNAAAPQGDPLSTLLPLLMKLAPLAAGL